MLPIALLFLLPVALAARGVARTWLSPGPFFAGYWALASILPLVFFDDKFVRFAAIAIFTLGAVIFASAASAAALDRDRRRDQSRPQTPVIGDVRPLVVVGTVASLFATAVMLRSNGAAIDSILSLNGLLSTGNALATDRYAGDNMPIVVPICLLFTYTAAILAPFTLLAAPHRWSRTLIVAPALSAVAFSTITTARLPMLIAAALTACGTLAVRMLKSEREPQATRKGVVVTLAAAAAVGVLFAGIAFVRVGRIDPAIVPVVQQKVASYAFGYEAGFSQWLEADRETRSLGWGTASFAGIGSLAGKGVDATRAYDESVITDGRGQRTNIYTIYRGLLLDFGLAGTLLVLALFGALVGRAYKAILIHRSVSAAGVLSCSYAVILLSSTMSILTFTNVVGAMLCAISILRLRSGVWSSVGDGAGSGRSLGRVGRGAQLSSEPGA